MFDQPSTSPYCIQSTPALRAIITKPDNEEQIQYDTHTRMVIHPNLLYDTTLVFNCQLEKLTGPETLHKESNK